MATLLLEGFDDYGPANIYSSSAQSLLNSGGWNCITPYTSPSIVASLTGEPGYAVSLAQVSAGAGATFSQSLGPNQNRLIGGFRFNMNLFATSGISFGDLNTSQFTILVEAGTGYIMVCQSYEGDWSSSPPYVARSTVAVAANTTHYLEFDITFQPNATGGITVWLDGVQVLTWTGQTSQSGNAWANLVQFVTNSGAAGNYTFDDFYLFTPSGSFNNAVLLSNPVIITQEPIADVQAQFTNQGNLIGYSYSLSGAFGQVNGNSLFLMKISPNVNCTLDDIVIQVCYGGNNSGANMKGVLYADNSGAPGSLLSTGTQVTGFVQNVPIVLPLATPTALTAGTNYWLGFITDTTLYLQLFDGVTTGGAVASNTYTSGAPATAPTMSYNQSSLFLYGECTNAAHNFASVDLVPAPGDISSVASATIGISDLYSYAALPLNITAVYSVGVKGTAKLSVAGTHTINMLMKSGTVTSAGSEPGLVPNLSYGNYTSYFDTDPNTSTTWTVSGVNNSSAGMSVAS